MKQRRRLINVPWVLGALLSLGYVTVQAEIEVPPDRESGQVLYIVGSTLMQDYTTAVMEHLEKNAALPPAIIVNQGSTRGIDLFCAGLGLDTPDILAISRKVHSSELNTCYEHGVTDIIEIQVGYEASVVVSRRDDQDYPLDLVSLYRAVAATLPTGNGDFVSNHATRWHEVDNTLPDTAIRFILPVRSLGGHAFFEDKILQGACRNIPEIRSIFDASQRVKQCIAMRNDGRILEMDTPYNRNVVQTLASSPHGTLAILPLRFATEHQEFLKIQALGGVIADYETVSNHQYTFTRPLYFLVKKAHIKNYRGRGLVSGLREFITEVTREPAIGPSGYLSKMGVFPMDSAIRSKIRETSLRLDTLDLP